MRDFINLMLPALQNVIISYCFKILLLPELRAATPKKQTEVYSYENTETEKETFPYVKLSEWFWNEISEQHHMIAKQHLEDLVHCFHPILVQGVAWLNSSLEHHR